MCVCVCDAILHNYLFYMQSFTDSRFTNAYDRLTSQSPDKFWTSGQWMTERKGGSDVGKRSRPTVLLECYVQ